MKETKGMRTTILKMNKQQLKYLIISLGFFMLHLSYSQQTDLSLEKAINLALESNYGIIISGMETDQAKINNDRGMAGRYPTISLRGMDNNTYDMDNGSWNYNNLNVDLGLNWILFNGFKIVNTKDKLEALEDLAEGNSSVLIENTIQDVILGYFMILLEKEKLNVLKEVMGLSKDRYDYELKRQELGGSVTYQVLQAKNNYLSDKVTYLNREVALRNAIRNLDFLMGLDTTGNWNYIENFAADTGFYLIADLKDKMLANNNVLKNQYINLKLKQNETELKKGDLYPSLSISTGVSDNYPYTLNAGTAPGDNAISAYGNINLTYNIFTGGIRKKAIQVAKLDEEIAMTGLDEIMHILLNQLMNVFDLYEVRKEVLNVADENRETAALNLKIAQEKYKTGVINSFNYRDIQLVYTNAAISRSEAIYNLIESHTELVRLIGGLVEEEKE